MKSKYAFALSLIFVCLFTLPTFSQLAATATARYPIVHKIDPPSWWVNYTPELTLLLKGENLSGAHVVSASKAVEVRSSDASSNGHYLFVRLKILTSQPLTAQLKVNTDSGSTSVQLPLLARADSRAHFKVSLVTTSST